MTQGGRIHAVVNLLLKQNLVTFKILLPKRRKKGRTSDFFFFFKSCLASIDPNFSVIWQAMQGNMFQCFNLRIIARLAIV